MAIVVKLNPRPSTHNQTAEAVAQQFSLWRSGLQHPHYQVLP
jgi:hypothetical protein